MVSRGADGLLALLIHTPPFDLVPNPLAQPSGVGVLRIEGECFLQPFLRLGQQPFLLLEARLGDQAVGPSGSIQAHPGFFEARPNRDIGAIQPGARFQALQGFGIAPLTHLLLGFLQQPGNPRMHLHLLNPQVDFLAEPPDVAVPRFQFVSLLDFGQGRLQVARLHERRNFLQDDRRAFVFQID